MSAAGSGESSSRRMPRSWRITSSREIRGLLQRGKRSRTAHLDVFDSASPLSHARAGIIVPKYRHNSVQRNRLKRQLREVVRLEVLPRLAGQNLSVDVLIRARREAYDASFRVLREELIQWVERRWRRSS